MSAPQSPRKSINLFKDEVFGSLREIELNFKSRLADLESKVKKDVEDFKMKINQITVDHKEMKEILIPQKVKIEKIGELENFKNKFNDMLITHEVRIKNNFDEITKSRLRYDKLISENLYVPGFIGSACQFKNLSDYLSFNINEVSKLKIDKDQVRKDIKELKTRQDNMMKSMVTLNETSVQICNTYADGKYKEIKEILNRALEQLNQKSFEMRTMIHQFVENAKKIEEKSKVELDNIIEIKNNINNEFKNNAIEIKKFTDDLTKKIKDNNDSLANNKKKIENLTEQLKDVNKNILNINTKLKNNNNTSNIFNNRSKINLTKSVSPTKERRFKTIVDIKNSSSSKSGGKYYNENNDIKNRNKSEISLDSIITENSDINNNNKKTKDLKVNLKESNKNIFNINNNNNKEKNNLNTINNISDFNKPKVINDSLNNTNTNSINNGNMKISSIQNSKGLKKNNTESNNNIFSRGKDSTLPTILKNREITKNNLLNEEIRKTNENINLTRLKKSDKYNMTPYSPSNLLKIKNTKIVLKLDDNYDFPYNNNDDYNSNNNININDKRHSINKNILNNNINMNNKRHSINKISFNNNININTINSINSTTIPKKKVKFNHRKEIVLKKVEDSNHQKDKDKEKKELKLVSLTLPKTEEDSKKDKTAKEELSSTIDNYRVNAFTNLRNISENIIDISSNEEMLDFPKKAPAFGRTTYNFLTKNDVINHINANQNINNFELINKKNKK